MNRYLILFVVLMLSITAYPLSSMQSLEKKSQDIFIYQISPEFSPLIRTSFVERTNNIIMENHNQNDGYLILSTASIANAVKSSDFISWKESLGYNNMVDT